MHLLFPTLFLGIVSLLGIVPGIVPGIASLLNQAQAKTITSHQLTLIGNSKYPETFSHFDYVNPDAPKGGIIRLATTLNFDSLNPFNNKSVAPPVIYDTHARLMIRSADESYSLYGFVAERIEYPENYEWVIFHINPKARFSDGSPITAEDIAFTLKRLQTEASPFFKNICKNTSVEVITPLQAKFTFITPGAKAIALAGYMPVLSRRYWENRSLGDKLTEAPVSSGPIRPVKFNKGQSVTYERIKNYWGAELPVNKGRYNFDQIRIDVYRDQHAAIEAFKAGLYDLRYEYDINQWQQAYKTPALKEGRIKREILELEYPPGMTGLVFNIRLSKFQDIRVRKALTLLFDFEWINQKLLHSGYQRTQSFFSYTALEAKGLPDKNELNLLTPFRHQLDDTAFGPAETPTVTKGDGNNRTQQRTALKLLKEAGWEIDQGIMRYRQTGEPLTITILSDDYSQERLLVPYRKMLSKAGIDMDVQTVDKSLFRKRMRQFDFEMANWHFWHSLFPGQEQQYTYSSLTANQPGSGNIAGIKNPAIDDLLDRLLSSKTYNDLIPIGRALDRILRSNYYLIPKWHTRNLRMLYWDHIEHPQQQGLYWHTHNEWWARPENTSSSL